MNKGIELANDLFKRIKGIKPTRAIQGHGSFITIDFGRDLSEQVKTRSGPPKTWYYGEWRLWIYMCAWRIDVNKKPYAGSEDSREKIENSLSYIIEKELSDCFIMNNAFDAKLTFGGDIELHLFSFYTELEKQWMLFTPEKKVFVAGPGNQWSYNDADRS
jgi:hypothetical protein